MSSVCPPQTCCLTGNSGQIARATGRRGRVSRPGFSSFFVLGMQEAERLPYGCIPYRKLCDATKRFPDCHSERSEESVPLVLQEKTPERNGSFDFACASLRMTRRGTFAFPGRAEALPACVVLRRIFCSDQRRENGDHPGQGNHPAHTFYQAILISRYFICPLWISDL